MALEEMKKYMEAINVFEESIILLTAAPKGKYPFGFYDFRILG
ncbi:hypothetical protein ACTXHP_05375 [Bacillus stercoris]